MLAMLAMLALNRYPSDLESFHGMQGPPELCFVFDVYCLCMNLSPYEEEKVLQRHRL